MAAGSGSRLAAGGPKALVPLAGKPLVAWSIRALAAAESVCELVIAAPPGAEGKLEAIAAAELGEAAIPVEVVTGGDSRSGSVTNCIARCAAPAIAIHDAARPLVTPALVDRLVARLQSDPGADAVIAAAPVADTIKRVDEIGAVAETIARDHLWAVQTPQVFRAEALREAHEVSPHAIATATDDAALVEVAGGTVLVEPFGEPNIKVTLAADLAIAEVLLAARGF